MSIELREPPAAPCPRAEPRTPPRVLAVCPGVWDREGLGGGASRGYELVSHGAELLEPASVLDALRFDVFRWADATATRFRDARLAGVVGTGDYPGCMLAAMVAERLGLPTPRPETVVVLSHKYHSRRIQQRAVPEVTPAFEPIDPYARRRTPRLGYPLFVKPVKGTMSIRARMVHDDAELRCALSFRLRERIEKHLLLRPFDHLLKRYTDASVPAHWFIGERPLGGVQVTVDGFVQGGRATVMGVVDSVMFPGTRSFARFEYPSRLPVSVQERMARVVCRAIEASGFDAACFNVEMFWDETTDALGLIEINPRMSYQFADLYERVDGTNTYSVQLGLATGTPVRFRAGGGRDGAAGSFVLRRFSDARVVRVPTPREIDEVCARFPGTTVKVLCAAGERLSQHDQDPESYRYGIVNLGAPTREELLARWDEVSRALRFEFA